MKMFTMKKLLVAAAMLSLISGCAQPGPEAKKDALIGAAGGAIAGQLIGGNTGATLAGAAIGAAAGGIYGDLKDKENQTK